MPPPQTESLPTGITTCGCASPTMSAIFILKKCKDYLKLMICAHCQFSTSDYSYK
jgi:hypothetical protein